MAEFKLGRIRFVWKNDWQTEITYYKDDVVAFGGKIYICVEGHVSSADFFSDFDITPPKWNLVSDGQTWRGEWQPQTRYIFDDIVKYGARLYICQTIHVSAEDSSAFIDDDIDYWEVFAEGLDWKGNWDVETNYKINDMVKYGGATYVCTTAHISTSDVSLGLENDIANWDVFNQGLEFKSTWTPTTRYKLNDVVQYGAGLYIATQYHTSTTDFGTDAANWEKFVDGFQYEDEWLPTFSYQPGDVVRYGGNTYLAKITTEAEIPPATPDSWELFSQGIKFLGDWNEDSSNQHYKVGELVTYGANTYLCIQDHETAQDPSAATEYWSRLNTGLRWRGEWVDDQEYIEGDVVRYGDNSYVCVLGHVSEGDDYSSLSPSGSVLRGVGSRPDQDDSGLYWNIIAIGTEQSVLNTTGDLVYYSGNGPARLPIGKNGQILTVGSQGLPEWAFLGNSQDVYYVAEHGVDSPAPIYGKSIDRPFKTVRYAAQQIEKGAKVPEAAELLKLNRRFIQREIVEWTDYQIANSISPFGSNFEYDSAKCERDMGYIIDAFIWDLTHGGNIKSRTAALKYVKEPGSFYTLGQEGETVASIQYGISLIQKVLAQEAPDVNYQELNGDNSTAIVEQYFNTAYGRLDNAEYEGVITGGSTGGVYSGNVTNTDSDGPGNIGGGYY